MNTSELFQKELDKKFTTPEKFAEAIEAIVRADPDQTYISAIVEYCEKNNLEVESITKLIPKPLKEKLRNDAQRLNYITHTKRASLPL